MRNQNKLNLHLLTVMLPTILLSTLIAYAQEDAIPEEIRNPFESFLPIVVEAENPDQGGLTTLTKDQSGQELSTPDIELTKPVITLPALKILGLVWNTARPQAIINDRVLELGDTIEEVKIVAIKKEGIDIEFEGIPMTLIPTKE